MAVGCINNQYVDAGVNQQFDTFFRTGSDADSCTGKQFAVFIFGSIRMFGCFDDVFDGHQAAKVEVVVNNQNSFKAMLVHQFLSVVECGAFFNRDQALGRCHDFTDLGVHAVFEAKVAVCNHTEDFFALNNGKTGNVVFASQTNHVGNNHVRTDGDRVGNHACFVAFNFINFGSLSLGCHVFMNNTDAAFLS